MIVAMRIDHRLVHGQVAFSWVTAINANCILAANDDAAHNEIQMTALQLAAPQGVKVVVKTIAESIQQINSGVTDKYRLLIVVKNVQDAWHLISECKQIKELNVAGTNKTDNSEQVTSAVYLTAKDKQELKMLSASGVRVFSQMVPSDKSIDLIKKL